MKIRTMKPPPNTDISHTASFRDPSGFLFYRDGELFRQVNKIYKDDYDLFIDSSLYQTLIKKDLLIPHQEISISPFDASRAYKIIKPEPLLFISYPYEWCFSQLKEGALLTLAIQKKAFKCGMSLKDCSAYNVQFKGRKPIFIDTLSFEKYREGEPWIAYRQFCQHFLAPLALMAYKDVRLSQLLRIYIDGIPLDLAAKLLPARSRFNFSILSHIHFHAKSQQRYAGKGIKSPKRKVSRLAFRAIIDSLESAVRKLTWNPGGTEWADYYQDTNYSDESMKNKEDIVDFLLAELKPPMVWDLGANIGTFSRLASERDIPTIAFDIDPSAVEKNYIMMVDKEEDCILPLVMDLTNPSPALGWSNRERSSLIERGPVHTLLALALIHHLAISNNLPLDIIAKFFSKLSKYLLIEFIPKEDSQVQRLLSSREDIFPDYNRDSFEHLFAGYFKILKREKISSSERYIYLMKNNEIDKIK